MKRRLYRTGAFLAGRLGVAAVALALTTLVIAPQVHAKDRVSGRHIVGTWFLALDAGPFAPPFEGLFLSGLMQIHRDRTFMISDAGDFAADSFIPTFATPQYGAWKFKSRYGSNKIVATSLYLEAQGETGEAFRWNRVQFKLRVIDRNRVEGMMSASYLPCPEMPPFPTPLTCPDPVENADEFVPDGPADVPVTLTRIVPGK